MILEYENNELEEDKNVIIERLQNRYIPEDMINISVSIDQWEIYLTLKLKTTLGKSLI